MTPESFKQLVMPRLDALYNRARRRTRDAELAEDLVQDACLRAWQSIESLREVDGFGAWLVRILDRGVAEHFRSAGRRQALVPITRLEAIHEETVATQNPGPLEHAIALVSDERVMAALDRVPEIFADAVALHDIEGFTYAEIAEITGVAVGTVMSRISRGRRLLGALILEQADAWGISHLGGAHADKPEETR